MGIVLRSIAAQQYVKGDRCRSYRAFGLASPFPHSVQVFDLTIIAYALNNIVVTSNDFFSSRLHPSLVKRHVTSMYNPLDHILEPLSAERQDHSNPHTAEDRQGPSDGNSRSSARRRRARGGSGRAGRGRRLLWGAFTPGLRAGIQSTLPIKPRFVGGGRRDLR